MSQQHILAFPPDQLEDGRSTASGPIAARADRPEQSKRGRQTHLTTADSPSTEDEFAFVRAMDQYKRDNRRPNPTWREVLDVLRALGFRRVAEPTQMQGREQSSAKRFEHR